MPTRIPTNRSRIARLVTLVAVAAGLGAVLGLDARPLPGGTGLQIQVGATPASAGFGRRFRAAVRRGCPSGKEMVRVGGQNRCLPRCAPYHKRIGTGCVDQRHPNARSGWWTQVGGALANVSVGAAGQVWGVNPNGMIFRWSGGRWQRVPGGLKQISVGADGAVWGVNPGAHVYRYRGGRWQGMPGRLTQISVGSAGQVWGVASNQTIHRWDGTRWANVPGRLTQVSVGSDGAVWGLDAAGHIFQRVGRSWRRIPGGLQQISVGDGGRVWGVNRAGDIYRRAGTRWAGIPGKLRQVSVAADGTLWGVGTRGEIWRGTRTAPKAAPGAPVVAAKPAPRPRPSPPVGSPGPTPVPVYRETPVKAPHSQYHFSTRTAAAAARYGWKRLEIAFRAFKTQAPGTVPIYVESPIAKPYSQFHFWHRSAAEAKRYGWQQHGVAFYAYPKQVPGTVPVYRETPKRAPHTLYHYSTRPAAAAARYGWMRAGVAFYAFPAQGPVPARPPTVAVYRETPVKAPHSQYHFSTRSAAEAVRYGWKRLGIAFRAFKTQAPGTVPIYVESPIAKPYSQFHFWHRSAAEAKRYGWRQHGVAFYAYPKQMPGTVPVYRETLKRAPHTRYHYSTRAAAEAQRYGWMRAGVAFYAFPATGAAPPSAPEVAGPAPTPGGSDAVSTAGEAVQDYPRFRASWGGWKRLFRREGQVFRADVRIVNQPVTLIVYFPRGKKKPNVAVLATNLAVSNLIEAAQGTPFDDLVVRSAIFIFAPKQNEEWGRVDTLPPAIRERVRAVRPATFHLVEGHNLFAVVEPRQSSSTASLLRTLGLDLQNLHAIVHKGRTCARIKKKSKKGRWRWRKEKKDRGRQTCWQTRSVLVRRKGDWREPFHLNGVTLHDPTVELLKVAGLKTLRGWGRATVRGKQYFLFAQHTPQTKGLAFALDARSISLWDYWNVFSTVARTVVGAAGLSEVQQVMQAIDGLPLDEVRVENPAYDAPGYSPLKNLDEDGQPIFDNALIAAATPTERLPDAQGTCGPIVIAHGRGKAFGATVGTLEARIERDGTDQTRPGQPCRPRGRLRYHARGTAQLPQWGPVKLGSFDFLVHKDRGKYQMAFRGQASVGAGPFQFSDRVEITASKTKGGIPSFSFQLAQSCPRRPMGIKAWAQGRVIGSGGGFGLRLTGSPLACAQKCFSDPVACAQQGAGWAAGVAKRAYEGAKKAAGAAARAARQAASQAANQARTVASHVTDAFAGTVRKVSDKARKGIHKASNCLKSAFTDC